MFHALRQEDEIALAQFLPALSLGMDPAWPLADEVEAQQGLLGEGDAPGVMQFETAIIDAAQPEVLQHFTQGIMP